ncbi:reverse transcriptase [Gossypium australe]|uniref:Reverse transcriptase n=1 Tax=Gossypium australe TaxID=47621 RepID=A0A5B6UC19_9ROSI|nr:reverse transcriptase [Gossypium australe]
MERSEVELIGLNWHRGNLKKRISIGSARPYETPLCKWKGPSLRLILMLVSLVTAAKVGQELFCETRMDSLWVLQPLSCLFAEAVAAVKAIETTLDTGCSRIILEGDAFVVMKGLASNDEDYSDIGPILLTDKALLQRYSMVQISYTRRDGNKATHDLAKFNLNVPTDLSWIDEYPPCFTKP